MNQIPRSAALNALLMMTEGATQVSSGIPQHIQDHPELPESTRVILEMCATVIPALVSVATSAVENAFEMEDRVDQMVHTIKKKIENS